MYFTRAVIIIEGLRRDYNKNGTHPSGMWGSQESLNPKFQSLCSKNGAAQAPTPPRNDKFSARNDDSSFSDGGTFITFLKSY